MKNYIEIEVVKISQFKEGLVFGGKIRFKDLKIIHKITERKESLIDPFSKKKIKINIEEEFQRQLSRLKLNKISEFLMTEFKKKRDEQMGIFPTSIILALKHDIEYDSEILNKDLMENLYKKEKRLSSCFIYKIKKEGLGDDFRKLYVPKNEKICLIVDGQHRFYGFKKFYEELKEEDKKKVENFEFPVTFLVGFDIYTLGKVFAKVNFEQKPVNRSLYYDIFGSIPDIEKNDIKMAHDLALHLNNSEESPLKDMIKILGRGRGLFSQSLFVEKIIDYFEKGVWEEIYGDYLKDGKKFTKLPLFMRNYFNAIKKAYPTSWPKKVEMRGKRIYSSPKYNYILCKSTGIGALLELIEKIYPKVKDYSEIEMGNKIFIIFKKISDKEAKTIFSKKGKFGGGGGYGLQSNLRKLLERKLSL